MRACRIVWIETLASSAISAWLMQPATWSVAVLKSISVDVQVDKRRCVDYNIDTKAKSKAAGHPQQVTPTALPRTDPKAALSPRVALPGVEGSSPLVVHDAQVARSATRGPEAERIRDREVHGEPLLDGDRSGGEAGVRDRVQARSGGGGAAARRIAR